MVAGKPITRIDPIVSASSSPIYSAKAYTITTLTALTTATGTMTAGRTIDGNNTLRDAIIAWVRGADNLTTPNEDPNTDTTPYGNDIRPSVHGDVLHSRPAVVNYNRYGDDNDIYAFYGSNDGIFHGLKGGTANHTTGPDTAINPGTERWGFIPREFFSSLQRLRNQSPTISGSIPRNYFADGSIGVFSQDAKGNGNSQSPLNCIPGSCSGADTVSGVIGDNVHPIYGDKIYLYMTMRRGARLIYALDVTNPATPKLLWRHTDADSGWDQLGLTFSEPRIAKLAANIGNPNNPNNVVLIFGAGYQRSVDDINPCLLSSSDLTQVVQVPIGSGSVTYTASGSCTVTGATGSNTTFTRTRGRAIMVVDAFDGTMIWQAGAGVTTSSTPRAMKLNVPDMGCAIPSDTTVLDKNRDGLADRIYVGDTCGQVWRADITSSDMTQWTVTKIAAMSSATSTDIANKRKFLFPPDLVFGTDANGFYTAVLIGSGDREHPFDTTVVNRFYMIKDRDTNDPQTGVPNSSSVKIAGFGTPPTGAVLTDADVFDATTAALVSGTDPLGLNGWKITLAAGEKVVSSATSVAGSTFFNTNQPSSTAGGGACGSNLGIAREYQVGFADASATADLNGVGGITIADRSTIHAGGGYLPSPVPVVVEIDGKKYQAVISGTSVQTPPGLTLEKRTRQYWYKQID
jgi:type IV pilus assembly protein PilY1